MLCEECGDVLRVPSQNGDSATSAAARQDRALTPMPPSTAARRRPRGVRQIVCSDCGTEVPAELGMCIRCGKDLRSPGKVWARKAWQGIEPDEDLPVDPGRPAVSFPLYNVGWGLQLVLWYVVLAAFVNAALLAGPYFLEGAMPLIAMFRVLAGLQLLSIVVMLVGIAGRSLCLLVPEESQAKLIIFITVILELYSVLVNTAYFFTEVSTEAYAAGKIASLLASVLFLVFLKKLAVYLRRGDLQSDANKSLWIGILFVVAGILAVLARFFPQMPFAQVSMQLFAVGSLVIVPVLFFPYVLLLGAFRRAFRELS